MKVLIFGGRDFMDHNLFLRTVAAFNISHVVCGYDPKTKYPPGADQMAYNWAKFADLPVTTFPAEWERYDQGEGRKNPAGMIRNRQMLVEGRPEMALGFPGGNGTAHMMDLAIKVLGQDKVVRVNG